MQTASCVFAFADRQLCVCLVTCGRRDENHLAKNQAYCVAKRYSRDKSREQLPRGRVSSQSTTYLQHAHLDRVSSFPFQAWHSERSESRALRCCTQQQHLHTVAQFLLLEHEWIVHRYESDGSYGGAFTILDISQNLQVSIPAADGTRHIVLPPQGRGPRVEHIQCRHDGPADATLALQLGVSRVWLYLSVVLGRPT